MILKSSWHGDAMTQEEVDILTIFLILATAGAAAWVSALMFGE